MLDFVEITFKMVVRSYLLKLGLQKTH